jgi:hypothetical protein
MFEMVILFKNNIAKSRANQTNASELIKPMN